MQIISGWNNSIVSLKRSELTRSFGQSEIAKLKDWKLGAIRMVVFAGTNSSWCGNDCVTELLYSDNEFAVGR